MRFSLFVAASVFDCGDGEDISGQPRFLRPDARR